MATEVKDFSQLSDDELMNLSAADVSALAAIAQEPEQEELPGEEQEQEQQEEEEGQESEEQEEQPVKLEDEDEDQRADREAKEEEGLDEEELTELRANREAFYKEKNIGAAKKVEPAAKGKDQGQAEAPGFDVEAAKKLFEPFTANGRKMNIRNAEEGIRLMQLGAGYNAKMEQFKPQLAIARTLEKAGITSQDQLNFLIDLHNKTPEAIAKLVKDSGVDVLDIDEEKVKSYKSGDYSTSPKEVEMDEVLDSLQSSPHYAKLTQAVAKEWDSASKREVGNNPGVLNLIHQHMEAGYYDKIVEEYTRQKALGTIGAGVPFLQAYSQIGDKLNAEGAFAAPEQQQQQPARKLVTPGKEKARQDRDSEQRRKSAAPAPRNTSPTVKKPVADVWSMSDDDFGKLNIR